MFAEDSSRQIPQPAIPKITILELGEIFGFTPEEAHLNAKGILSENQNKTHVRRGIIMSVVILLMSTCFVLNYIFLIAFAEDGSWQDFATGLWIIGGLLYATSIFASVFILRQHWTPQVQSVRGRLEIPQGRRVIQIDRLIFILTEEQLWRMKKIPNGIDCHIYFFESVLGRRLLSIVPMEE